MTEASSESFIRIRNLKDEVGNRYYNYTATVSTNYTITVTPLTTINGFTITVNEDVAPKATSATNVITVTSTHTSKVATGMVWGV